MWYIGGVSLNTFIGQRLVVNCMYYLKNTNMHECFIRYKMRGAASCHFVYERIFNIDVVQAEKIEAKVL